MSDQNQNRLFELVNELVGAQTTARLVQDAIAGLTPEQLARIGAAFTEEAIKNMPATVSDFTLGRLIEAGLGPIVDKLVAERCEALTERLRKRMEIVADRELDAICQRALTKALREARDRFWPSLTDR